MSYAKPCKYCKTTQIVWNAALSKFKENDTGEVHTRERCEAIRNGQLNVGDNYKITSAQQQIPVSTNNPAFEKYNENKQTLESAAIQMINTKVDKCLDLLKYIIDNTGTAKEISELKTINAQLRAVLAEKENFVPANQVLQEDRPHPDTTPGTPPSPEDYDQHVRDMVEKGRQAEEDGEELEQ